MNLPGFEPAIRDNGWLNVFISPHFDDVAFSIGETALKLNAGLLINCVTQSNYVNDMAAAGIVSRGVAEVSMARAREDRSFAETCGLQQLNLGGLDPSLLGRRPGDLGGMADDCNRLRPLLEPALDQAVRSIAEGKRLRLFGPGGFGRHVQHRATCSLFLDWLASRRDSDAIRQAEIYLYEELPYCSKLLNRLGGTFRLKRDTARRFPGRRLRRIALPLEPGNRKLSLCGLYASQLKRVPSYRDYSPALAWPFRPHEAVWRLEIFESGKPVP